MTYQDGFDSHAARLTGKMIAAHCADLLMTNIRTLTNGQVEADIGMTQFTFEWCVDAQTIQIVGKVRVTPVSKMILDLDHRIAA